ncbi:MAG: hypothetical protein ACJ75J_07850 [Cytophagaceae bacterium]
MKKLLIILCAILAFSSCKKIHLTTFNAGTTQYFTVPAATPIGVFNTLPVQTSSQNSFQSQGIDVSHIKEASLDKMSLTITSPGESFDFVDKIHIYISASGQAEQELAYLDPIPHTGLVSIDLKTTGIDLVEYIKQDSYYLRIATTTNQIVNQDVNMRADMTFKVKAKLIK